MIFLTTLYKFFNNTIQTFDSDLLNISAIAKWMKNKFKTKIKVKLVIWVGHIILDQNRGTIANCSRGSWKKLNWKLKLNIIKLG
jgi:hypothetical protein